MEQSIGSFVILECNFADGDIVCGIGCKRGVVDRPGAHQCLAIQCPRLCKLALLVCSPSHVETLRYSVRRCRHFGFMARGGTRDGQAEEHSGKTVACDRSPNAHLSVPTRSLLSRLPLGGASM